MTRSAEFSIMVIRGDEEIEVNGTAYSTGHKKSDCGGDSDGLDYWDSDDDSVELTESETERMDEAAMEALQDG